MPLWKVAQPEGGVTLAAAVYVRAEVYFCDRDFQSGRLMVERATQKLEPVAEREWATYDSIHMRAAVVVA